MGYEKMRERHIVLENRIAWIYAHADAYTVYVKGVSVSTPDSSYTMSADGLSIAIARCNWHAAKRTILPRQPINMQAVELLHAKHRRQ